VASSARGVLEQTLVRRITIAWLHGTRDSEVGHTWPGKSQHSSLIPSRSFFYKTLTSPGVIVGGR
jgi:hypothetical protein